MKSKKVQLVVVHLLYIFQKKKKIISKDLELAIINEENSRINNLDSWKKFALKVEDHRKKMQERSFKLFE